MKTPEIAKKTILYVDDDGSIRFLYELGFNDHGYEALTANDINEALKLNSNSIDLVLVDVSVLGNKDPQAEIKKIKDGYLGISVVLLSGYSEDYCRKNFPGYGYIEKTGDTDVVCELVKQYL